MTFSCLTALPCSAILPSMVEQGNQPTNAEATFARERERLLAEGFEDSWRIRGLLTTQTTRFIGGIGPRVWKEDDHIEPGSERDESVFGAVFGEENVTRIPYMGLDGKQRALTFVRHGLGDLHHGFTQNEVHGLGNFACLFAQEFHEPGSVTPAERQRAREVWDSIHQSVK